MATIITKNSGTASSVPTGAQLTAGELAVNTADKRLFTKNGGGTVVELGTNPSSLTLPNGTANGVPYLNASKVLTSGSALTFDGTNLGVGGAATSYANYKTIAIVGGSSGGVLDINPSGGPTAGGLQIASTAASTFFDVFGASGGSPGFASFRIGTYGALVEQMRLTSTGLGIGTSSVTDKLTVAGNISTPNNNGFSSKFTNGAAYVLLKTDPSNIIQLGDIAGYSKAGAQLQFFASGSVAATFDQAGNLGLGVTPSAWGSGLSAFDINGRGGLAYLASAGQFLALSNNVYYNAGYKYKATAGAGQMNIGSDGSFVWLTAPSGTAGNAITFTQAMTLDSSGTLSVGQRIKSTGNAAPASGSGPELFWDGATGGVLSYNRTSSTYLPLGFDGSDIRFYTTSGERARIDSGGNWIVGQTSTSVGSGGIAFLPNANQSLIYIGHVSGTASGTSYHNFYYGGSAIGSITQNGTTGVLYNLTSDYRLKNNPVPVTGAKEFINALQPKTWDWWDGSGKGVGFIAHEFMEVAKYSGNGTKDAVDDDGNPVYQSIQPSSSEVMANLVAYVQELRAEFDAYKAAHP